MRHLEDDLVEVVGADHVLTSPEVRASYETDWTRRFSGRARAVVRPASGEEVAGVLVACGEAGVGVTIQGGNTGLVGGSVPADGDVLLSTTRIRWLGRVDPLSGSVTAGAGVTLGALAGHLEAAGLEIPLDLAARDSATLGGIVATNAGGIRATRHGSARSLLVGVEGVLGSGARVGSIDSVPKDNTGYHWPSLLAGSEGTLAVITAVRFRAIPPPPRRAVVLLGLGSTEDAVAVAATLRESGAVEALEVFYAEGLELVLEHRRLAAPFTTSCPVYLLVEIRGSVDQVDTTIAQVAALPQPFDAVVGDDPPSVRRLWELREAHTEAISAFGVPHKLDVAVPLGAFAGLEREVRAVVAARNAAWRTIIFGHIGDANLHVNVLGPEPDDEAVDEAILRLVAASGGTISSEHGIGRAKTKWLSLSRSEADIDAMRAVKSALDPLQLLNRGVLLP
jgi:FAD/FMN-containing dehydrogenase